MRLMPGMFRYALTNYLNLNRDVGRVLDFVPLALTPENFMTIALIYKGPIGDTGKFLIQDLASNDNLPRTVDDFKNIPVSIPLLAWTAKCLLDELVVKNQVANPEYLHLMEKVRDELVRLQTTVNTDG